MKKMVYGMFLVGIVLSLFYACASTTGRTAGEIVDDTTIANTIRAKIVEDKQLSILKIGTTVFNGNVTFTGVVPSKDAESRLVGLANSVKGVKSVVSNLTVEKK